MSNRVDIETFSMDKFEKNYSRKLYNAIRKAAYSWAPSVVKQFRQDGLEGPGKKRQKAVNFKVRKNNTVAFIDSGFDARTREYGATIRPKSGKSLRIVIDPKYRQRLGKAKNKSTSIDTFVIKTAKGPVVMERKDNGDAVPIAVLKKQVKRQPINPNDRLSKIAVGELKNYERDIEREIGNIDL